VIHSSYFRRKSQLYLIFSQVYCTSLRVVNHVRVRRAQRDWSQAELARRLGVSRQSVNSIETGRHDPSLPVALKLARLFGARVEELFSLEEDGGAEWEGMENYAGAYERETDPGVSPSPV